MRNWGRLRASEATSLTQRPADPCPGEALEEMSALYRGPLMQRVSIPSLDYEDWLRCERERFATGGEVTYCVDRWHLSGYRPRWTAGCGRLHDRHCLLICISTTVPSHDFAPTSLSPESFGRARHVWRHPTRRSFVRG